MKIYRMTMLCMATMFFLFITGCSNAQKASQTETDAIHKIINIEEVSRIENVLASDAMKGRKTFSPEIDKAADFIANEFKKTGLQSWGNTENYQQRFAMVKVEQTALQAVFDQQDFDAAKILVFSTKPSLSITDKSNYKIETIKKNDDFFQKAITFSNADENILVFVNPELVNNFTRLKRFKQSMFQKNTSTVFILSDKIPASFSINCTNKVNIQPLSNVIGILPGKGDLKNEYVVFSAHYDHLGVRKMATGDSIYNGANDDAAGTTAVILLAKYFKALNNNQRTLIFVAFTAEEIGGFGSRYFSTHINADKVKAMFNIEMIGTESKWGANAAYITGYDKTDMGHILQKNLEGKSFHFYPDPYPAQHLFYRSDNATLARLGVPAHTISTAKMDAEPNYHKVSDEVSSLDLENMTAIIKAIAISAKSIISGLDTPTRVNVDDLN